MNRLPKIKKWINEEAIHFPGIVVNYVGGDPRFIFETVYLVRCRINGDLVEEEVTEKSSEVNIKKFEIDEIEKLLDERGVKRRLTEEERIEEAA